MEQQGKSNEMDMQRSESARITLVLGGVRSGKSRYAQRLAERTKRVAFVATAESRDDEEMLRKIARHRADRPSHWLTIEEPLKLAQIVGSADSDWDLILIDCLTLYASNLLEANGEDLTPSLAQVDDLCASLSSSSHSVVLVSNEVGSGVVPAYALGRRFRDLAGEINQRVAAIADTVVLMVAGLPLVLKGSLDEASQ
jgi:adenosylcobinamide kinase / adenosylcobinamide-phosphate guanylyltransferase